ncbi:hypothetical protein EDB80DRAFT_684262 [Ilyonectria destructans]|nr:hypothetical protein EDB80DRAFT_684262 [Ilyonectria destructans]
MQVKPLTGSRGLANGFQARVYNLNKQRETNKSSVTLFIGAGNGNQAPFKLTTGMFKELLGSDRLAKAFTRTAISTNGALGHFVDYSTDSLDMKPSTLLVVIASPYTPFHDFSLALRINIQNGAAVGLLFLTKQSSIPQMLEKFEYSREECAASPLSVLILLYDEFGAKAEEQRKLLDREVVRIEEMTVMTSSAITAQVLTDAEYEKLIRDMHACNTNLIFLSDLINYEIELGQFCLELYDIFEDLRRRATLPDFHSAPEKDNLLQWLKFLLKLSRFRHNQTQALRARIHSQTNLRDSRVNSTIADESRGIAQAAQRDSKTMRTIAFMTLVFLPSTLAASVFSTGIFDLSKTGGSGQTVVTPLWWIFAVVSLLLTTIVIVARFVWDRLSVRAKSD